MADVCGNCRHWKKRPLPPGPADLSEPPLGECRKEPPRAFLVGLAADGTPVMMSRYPPLHGNFPACGQYSPVPLPVLDGWGQDRVPKAAEPLKTGQPVVESADGTVRPAKE